MVQITINGKQIEVPEGTTVLRAAEMTGIKIPKLCDHKELTPYGGCRLCIVEVQGVHFPHDSKRKNCSRTLTRSTMQVF